MIMKLGLRSILTRVKMRVRMILMRNIKTKMRTRRRMRLREYLDMVEDENEVKDGDEVDVENTSAGGEVNFGLESKDGEGEGDASSDAHLDWNHW